MRMDNPVPTFSHAVSRLAEQYSNLAYLHVVEPRGNGSEERTVREGEVGNHCHKQIAIVRLD